MCPKYTKLVHLNEEIAFNEILQAEREEAATRCASATADFAGSTA